MTVTNWPSRFYPQAHPSNRFASLPIIYPYDPKRFHGSNQGEGVFHKFPPKRSLNRAPGDAYVFRVDELHKYLAKNS